uniref:Hemopexin n=1 Tax=Pavo cristatus TaxID=9049 RepID=A0A8C9LC67_PAVCR
MWVNEGWGWAGLAVGQCCGVARCSCPGGDVWETSQEGSQLHSRPLAESWPELEGPVDAAGSLQGEKVWSYAGGQLRPGFPRRIGDEFPGVPGDLDAAVECHPEECGGETVLFFKGDKVFSFDLELRVTKERPWLDVGPCDAALRWLERYYCLQGTQFHRFKPLTGEALPGYPRDLRDYFIPCPGRGEAPLGDPPWGPKYWRHVLGTHILGGTGGCEGLWAVGRGAVVLMCSAGGLSFRLDSWRDGWHAWPQAHGWPGLEGDVDAAFSWDKHMYLIQGSQVFIYVSGRGGHQQVEGYPRALQEELGVPKADAAFTCPGSAELYVITGDRVRRVDLTKSPRHADEPQPLPHDGVDGAMCTADGVYLLRGDSYHRYKDVAELLAARQPARSPPWCNKGCGA